VIWELRHKHKIWLLIEISCLARSTYYYYTRRKTESDKYSEVKEKITNIYHENRGRYGYRRITIELRNRGHIINHKTVQRLMKYLGLFCRVRMKKYRSYKGEVGKIAPNLLERDFEATAPNQKWVTDITEFSLFGQKLYLSSILDLYSRDIIHDYRNAVSGICTDS
jgi:putative transposase